MGAMKIFVGILACTTALAACGASSADQGSTSSATSSGKPRAQNAAKRGVGLVRVGNFSNPLYVTAPSSDKSRIYVVEQGGRVLVVKNGRKQSTPFLNISSQVQSDGEQGLLSIAFAPDFASSKLFYAYYTARSDSAQRVVEYKASSPDKADAGSAREVLEMADDESNHNGGQLQFGPDGLLYIGTGDGGGGGDEHGAHGNAQNLDSLLGKLLRIDPSKRSGSKGYGIPNSNPFVDRSDARPEIYSYGLRNPWRFSFDRSNGALSIGEVGQGEFEEVDYTAKGGARGANFGWRVFEGNSRFNAGESARGHVKPVLVYSHSGGGCSITGGYIVRDRAVPGLYGRYVYGDVCLTSIRSAKLSTSGASADRKISGIPQVQQVSSFGEDARGRVYVTSLNGPVYRFIAR